MAALPLRIREVITPVPLAYRLAHILPSLPSIVLAACGARTSLAIQAPADDSGARMMMPEAGADSAVPCPGSPSHPTVLVSIGKPASFDTPTVLTATGSFVYYAVNDESNNPLAIFRAPTTGGSSERIVEGVPGCASSPFGYGQLVNDGAHLFTPDEEEVSTCAGESLHVTAYDIATGTVTRLPNPPGAAPRYVTQVRAAPGGGALWLLPAVALSPGDTLLARWDGTSSSIVADIPAYAFDFVVAAGRAFVRAERTLYEVALVEGRGVMDLGPIDEMNFQFVGANDTAVFYTPDGTSLVRRDAVSGTEQTLANDVDVSGRFGDSMWADDAWVYFRQTHGADQEALARVPASGGPVEVIYDDTARGVYAVTSDACNVYWLSGPDYDKNEPSALFARRR
jgi:hypothetical protein